MKKIIGLITAALMLITMSCTVFAASDSIGVNAGEPMPDFSVELTDGSKAVLSELLKENDLVVLNIFASWCAPCEMEFPEMEKVYQENKDRMVIVSVSGDPEDTMEIISDYKTGHGLSFPMGLAGDALKFLNIPGFPTSIFIDKQGLVGFIKTGAFVGDDAFASKVSYFLSEDYEGAALESEIASGVSPLLIILLAIPFLVLFLIIGRWRLFKKAGKPGWHCLIPVLSDIQEFSLCWNGWFGLLFILLGLGALTLLIAILKEIIPGSNLTAIAMIICQIGFIVLILVESLKLSKAFGKKIGTGILLFITGPIGRMILGLSKAKYQAAEKNI